MPIRNAPATVADLPRSRRLKPLIVVGLTACYLATFVLLLPPSLGPRPIDRIATTTTALLTAAGGIGVMAYVARRWVASPVHVACLAVAAAGTVLACVQLPGPGSALPQGLDSLAIAVLAVCGAVCLSPSVTGTRPAA